MPDFPSSKDTGRPPRKSGRSLASTLALPSVILGLALAGCSVDVVDPNGTLPTQPQAAPASQLPTNAPGSPSAQSTRIDVPDESEEPEDPLQYARRSYYADKITATVDCASGEVVVAKSDQTVRITQDCAKVTVRAEYTNLLAERVGTLVVEESGEFSYVLVRSAAIVKIIGDVTDVWWDEGSPGVTVTGFDSKANPNPVRE